MRFSRTDTLLLLTAIVCVMAGGSACGHSAEETRAPVPASSPPSPPPAASGVSEQVPTSESQQATSLAAAGVEYQDVVYDKPIDARYDLRVIAAYKSHELTVPGGSTCCSTHLQVSLVRHGDPSPPRVIGSYDDQYEYTFNAERVTSSEMVLCSRGNYGIEAGCTKLFLDLDTPRIVAKIDFNWDRAVDFGDDPTGQRTLGVSPNNWHTLQTRGVFETSSRDREQEKREPPEIFTAHPLPQSTYAEFAKARPRRVLNGYGPGIGIEENPAGWLAAEGGVWFGRTFYDGEGSSGVGDVGFVTSDGKYRWLRIPEMADYSTLGLLVEPATIWVGRVGYPEGAVYGAGLLRFDRVTRRIQLYDIPEIIHAIVRIDDAVFLGTTHGLHVVRNETVTRYRMEPDLQGRLIVVAERVK